MALTLPTRLRNAWNAFAGRDSPNVEIRGGSYRRPDRPRFSYGTERSILSSVSTRIATDVAAITIKHAKLDANGRYLEDKDSGLNSCLNLSANVDQTGRAFIQDVVMSMLDEGVVAIVPVDTDDDPWTDNASFEILSLRTGKIIEWFPFHVKVSVYNERTGKREEILVPKATTPIIENPFYAIMNERNSTLQRLIHKLNLLDAIDEQSSSGKLDLIIQLPYVVKNSVKKEQAEIRRREIEEQLVGSKYGIAYTDGTERITQLNRPVENNLFNQVTHLEETFYNQLGLAKAIFDGTADERTQLDYHNRVIEPILSAIINEMNRKWLTKTARSQGQSIVFFRDPFRLVPVTELASIADTLTRNEILSSNELRAILGYRPSDDPKADELRNKNLNQTTGEAPPEMSPESVAEPNGIEETIPDFENQNG